MGGRPTSGAGRSSEGWHAEVDYAALSSALELLASLAAFAFLAVWLYNRVRRIESSLEEVKKRLERLEGRPDLPAAAPPEPEPRELISNVWGVPAVLFIVAALGGYSLLGPQLSVILFEAAGATALVAAAWEVVRRRT